MKLSAELLDTWDRCERRFAFQQKYESVAISPLGLLYSALEAAIVSDDPEQSAKDACMEIAAKSELQLTELNSFSVIRHVGLLAGLIGLALRHKLGKLEPRGTVRCDDYDWDSALFTSADGTNHRIVLTSHWDDDRLRSYAHSWGTIGELAALQENLTLTAIVIGAQRGGRRHSAWTKGFLHPVNHALRFARRQQQGSGFNEGWEEVWREHRSEISTDKWIAQMQQDGILDTLISSRAIAYKDDDNRMISARREIVQISYEMEGASESAPMRRSSCDETGRGACPYQPVCYSPISIEPSSLANLYRYRKTADHYGNKVMDIPGTPSHSIP